MNEQLWRKVLTEHQLRQFDTRGQVVHSAGFCLCGKFTTPTATAAAAFDAWIDHVLLAAQATAAREIEG